MTNQQSEERLRYLGVRPTLRASGQPPGLISVVVPAHNAAKHIGAQLSALATQDYGGAWEVIVADNGSTDGTRRVAESHRQSLPHLRTVDASAVKGAAHARNVGTAVSRGDAIAYADADDIVAADWLRKLVEALRHHDFVAGRMDQQALDVVDQPDTAVSRFTWSRLPTTLDFLPWGFGGNLAIRRAAFQAAGGWDETYPAVNDVPFCWRVQLQGYPLAYVPDAVVRYRARSDLRGLARQHRAFGRQHARLYRDFRSAGAQRASAVRVVRRWARITVSVPDLFRSGDRRRAWVRLTMMSLGRIQGSVEFRVVCL